jgi:hypothetical protein
MFLNVGFAQFTIDGQIIQRGEYRHGFGSLFAEDDEPAGFIGQRARIHFNYKSENLVLFASAQDIRVWGNTPQIKLTDNLLSVHEAWAEYKFSENWSIKTGRQELNYDNARFLGNLDWALQARAHDFALIKFEEGDRKLHFGGGFNQDVIKNAGSQYLTQNQYQNAQMMRYENKVSGFHYSLLFWNEGRQMNINDNPIFYRQTFGIPNLSYNMGNTSLSAWYYHQTGKAASGKKVNAYNASAKLVHKLNLDEEKPNSLSIAGGFEMLSGTATNDAEDNNSFAPLYGTNHAHNGFMDLFYVGNHSDNVGLNDFYVKTRYNFNPKLWFQADFHWFNANADIYSFNEKLNSHLGKEIDLTVGYLVSPAFSIQAGYSHYLPSDTHEVLANKGKLNSTQNWAYLMLIYRPNMKAKFIGVPL